MTRANNTQSGPNGPYSTDEHAQAFAQIFVGKGVNDDIADWKVNELASTLARKHGGVTVIENARGYWYDKDGGLNREYAAVLLLAFNVAQRTYALETLRADVGRWCAFAGEQCALVVIDNKPEFVQALKAAA